MSPHDVRRAVQARLPQAQAFLSRLIAIPSLSGCEQEAMDFAANAFAPLADVERMPMHDALRDDPDYSDPIPDLSYENRCNLRIRRSGTRGGRSLLLNTHIDTVPPAQGQQDPYRPTLDNGAIVGRGACDAKGQAATIFLAMAALDELNAGLAGDVIAHLVTEEENGGNGTLAMVRHGEAADACIVLEPTELRILSSVRGAVWFRITLRGKAGHSGQAGRTRSALMLAIRVIRILEEYHADLLAASRDIPLFEHFENPMPLTIGRLDAGNWPATAPSEAILEGVLGFLPNRTAAQVMQEITDTIQRKGGPDIAGNMDIHFSYRHDASVCPRDHELVSMLERNVHDTGRAPTVDGMPASCDAWFYNNQLEIPTVVFGGGSLGVAHSSRESMPLDELAAAAEVIAGVALKWCNGA